MNEKSTREGTHYKKHSVAEKEYISLRQLAKEVFPYPDNEEEYAYKKTLTNYKNACKRLGLAPKALRPGRDYQIPKKSKSLWILIIKYFEMLGDNPKGKTIENFFVDMTSKKEKLDERILNPKDDLENFFIEDMASFTEMFYAPDGKAPIIAHTYQNNLVKEIEDTYGYIIKKVPKDRIVMYAEIYYRQVNAKLLKTKALIRKMVEEKWWEK